MELLENSIHFFLCVYSETPQQNRKTEQERELREAIRGVSKQHQFFMYYQTSKRKRKTDRSRELEKLLELFDNNIFLCVS